MKQKLLSKLTEEKDRLLKDKNKRDKTLKPCSHGVKFAYMRPYLCEICSKAYVRYCLKHNLNLDKEVEAYKHFIEEELEKNRLLAKYGQELISYMNFKTSSDFKALGTRYERYIGYLFEIKGYKVDYNGIVREFDDGIDLIAQNKEKYYVVQCKRYGKNKQVHINTIDQLNGSAMRYMSKKKQKQTLIKMLTTPNDNVDDDATQGAIDTGVVLWVKPYPFDIGETYPLVKCNIGKNNEKIYHLPTDGSYDRIKIEISKGEFYAETPTEAEAKGFRRTKR